MYKVLTYIVQSTNKMTKKSNILTNCAFLITVGSFKFDNKAAHYGKKRTKVPSDANRRCARSG